MNAPREIPKEINSASVGGESKRTVRPPKKDEDNTGGLLGQVSEDKVLRNAPFILFVFVLVMLYIANRHFAESSLKRIDKVGKEVKDMRAEFLTTQAKLMYLSKQTEVAKRLSETGIKESVVPPVKITITKEELEKINK